MNFGFEFSSGPQELLRLAAAGEERAAIDALGAAALIVSETDYAPLLTCLLAIEATEAASALAKKWHRDNPASADANYYYALTEIHMKREDQAISIATEAMQRLGQTAKLLSVVGLALMSVQSLQNAGKVFQSALQQQSDPIVFAYLAEVLRLLGQTDQALAVMDRCFQAGCTEPEAYYLAGNVHYDAGNIQKAISNYDTALGQRPYYIEAHNALNRTLWEHGPREQFVKSFDAATNAFPDLLELKLRQAHFQIMSGNLQDASDLLEQCEKDFAPNARVIAELAGVQKQLDGGADIVPLFERAHELDATDAGMMKSYARALIEKGDYAKSAAISREARSIDALDQELIAYLATANTHIEPAEAARINDYDNFVQIFDLKPPAGIANIDSFNSSLLQALHPLHRSDVAPIDQTLVHGTQTHGNLFNNNRAEIQQLKQQISTCVQQYIEHLQKLGPGEFRDRISGGFDYSGAWSVQLSDGGFHLDHVHSAGWISSVYYVEVPGDLDASIHEGWLKFGDIQFDPNNTGPHRYVEPKPGRLVLFPSYMVHGTVPIKEHSRRTTVAFDVVPA